MAEPINLMHSSIKDLATATELAYIYAVLDQKDYRLSLAALIKLVTKDKIGLDKVDNTSDIDKPVSRATALELDKKANSGEVVSLQTYTAFVQSMQGVVTQTALDNALRLLALEIQGKITIEDAKLAIKEVTDPIDHALTLLAQDVLAGQAGQWTNYTSATEFNTRVQQLQQDFANELDTEIATMAETLRQEMAAMALLADFEAFKLDTQQRLTAIENALKEHLQIDVTAPDVPGW